MDLATLDTKAACNKGVEFELENPVTGRPIGAFITVLGKDSDVYRGYIRDMMDEYSRKEAINNKKRGGTTTVKQARELEAESIELLSVCTTGWRNIQLNGEDLPFNMKNCVMLYTEYPAIRTQVDAAIEDMGLFLSQKSTVSSISPARNSSSVNAEKMDHV